LDKFQVIQKALGGSDGAALAFLLARGQLAAPAQSAPPLVSREHAKANELVKDHEINLAPTVGRS
jgi:hypothetical protein